MKIVYNSIIPFQGYLAINLFGILFVRNDLKHKLDDVDINHETIHTKQMQELGYVFFYIIYVLEWLWRLLFTKTNNAYRDISFEKEAYKNEKIIGYCNNRKHFAQWRS